MKIFILHIITIYYFFNLSYLYIVAISFSHFYGRGQISEEKGVVVSWKMGVADGPKVKSRIWEMRSYPKNTII